jgi:hypothetical protein
MKESIQFLEHEFLSAEHCYNNSMYDVANRK